MQAIDSRNILLHKNALPVYIRGHFNHSALPKNKERKHSIGDGYRNVIVYYIGNKWIRVVDPFYLACGNYTIADFQTVLPTFVIEMPPKWSSIFKIMKDKVTFYEQLNKNADAAQLMQVQLSQGKYPNLSIDLDGPGADGKRHLIPQAIYFCMEMVERKLTYAYA